MFLGLNTQAQDMVENADTLRDNGKIYVVIACMSIIFVGVLGYLIVLERKLAKAER